MKQERKDGFRNAKIILTKKQAPVLPAHLNTRKPTSLLKHRFSLQPKSSYLSTTIPATGTKMATLQKGSKDVANGVCATGEVKQPVEDSKPKTVSRLK